MRHFDHEYLVKRASSLQKGSLTSLTNDILVDLIFPQLSIRDILRLRQVCRLFYELTHNSMVWKRILRQVHFPLPPLPPTTRYSMPFLSSFETERLVVRALTLEANWRSGGPLIQRGWTIPAFWPISSMKVLPGGQYMVASASDFALHRYAILLFMMDHRIRIAYPIAKMTAVSKPYHLQVKYMYYKGEMGVTIAYVRREPAILENRMAGVHVSGYSSDYDGPFPVPVRHEVTVLHCSLKALEVMEDPRYPPGSEEYCRNMMTQNPPFKTLATLRTRDSIDFLDLVEMNGQPYVFLAKKTNQVIMKNLDSGGVGKLYLDPLPEDVVSDVETWTIRGIRVLPQQNQILIVRTAEAPEDEVEDLAAFCYLTLEIYDLPEEGESIDSIAASCKMWHQSRTFGDIRISGHNPPSIYDQSVLPKLCQHAAPLPITVYATVDEPWGTLHYRLVPRRVPLRPPPPPAVDEHGRIIENAKPPPPPSVEETTHRYDLDNLGILETTFSPPRTQKLTVHAGATQAMVVGGPMEGEKPTLEVINVFAYADPVPIQPGTPDLESPWPFDKERREAAAAEREWVKGTFAPREKGQPLVPLQLGEKMLSRFVEGIRAITWDEFSGRVLMVPVSDPRTIYMFEFAHAPEEDQQGNRMPLPVPDVDQKYRCPQMHVDEP
ncbi:hypothetical protein DENSPDRAFT_333992 [Dentipellis sp. KUC8613]|nr:hypothetical protein DENSPDRAFT_333992 [Dentipellis sp. KUC8613]